MTLVTLARKRPLGQDRERPFPGVPLTVRETYRRLVRRGESAEAAANLTAYTVGLPVLCDDNPCHWTIDQVVALEFLRSTQAHWR